MDAPSLEDLLQGLKRFADANEQEKAELRRELYRQTAGKSELEDDHESSSSAASVDQRVEVDETFMLPVPSETDCTEDVLQLLPKPSETALKEQILPQVTSEIQLRDAWCPSLPTLLANSGGYNHRSMSKYIRSRREELLQQEELRGGLDDHALSRFIVFSSKGEP